MKISKQPQWLAQNLSGLLALVIGLKEKILSLISVIFIVLGAPPVIGQQNPIREADLIGSWQMNTPAKNCRIVLGDHSMMTIVTSDKSFLGTSECIKSSWQLSGNKVMIDDPSAERVLGKALLISQEKGEPTLLQQNEQEHNSKDGAKLRFVFRREHLQAPSLTHGK